MAQQNLHLLQFQAGGIQSPEFFLAIWLSGLQSCHVECCASQCASLYLLQQLELQVNAVRRLGWFKMLLSFFVVGHGSGDTRGSLMV